MSLQGYYDTSVPPSLLGGGPARPGDATLTIPEVTVTGGQGTQRTSLANVSGRNLTGLTGTIRIFDADPKGADPGDFALTMPDFDGPGADRTVTFTRDGDDLVGTYGPFPLAKGYTGHTDNDWTVSAPTEVYQVNTTISQGSVVLDQADWNMTVDDGSGSK